MIEFTLSGEDRIIAALKVKGDRLTEALMRKLDSLDARVQQLAQQKVEGQLLQHRTGKLSQSIVMVPAELDGTVIEGRVQAGGGPAFYARFQEEGTHGPYDIYPTKAKALAFLVGGKQVFAKHVTHPGLAGKRFLAGPLEEMKPTILRELQETVTEVNQS